MKKLENQNTAEYMAETPLNPMKVFGNQLLCWWLLAHILFYEAAMTTALSKYNLIGQ
jgi:hypothetical protein